MLDTERAERKAYMEDAPGHEPQLPVPLPPLRVSGLVVSRADLVAALRAYVPDLMDVRPLEGGEGFLLSLTPTNPEENGRS